jgi:hypothetical protein
MLIHPAGVFAGLLPLGCGGHRFERGFDNETPQLCSYFLEHQACSIPAFFHPWLVQWYFSLHVFLYNILAFRWTFLSLFQAYSFSTLFPVSSCS